MASTPVWLIDFDGVVNALSKRGDKSQWSDWRDARLDHPYGETNCKGNVIRLPLLWSDAVIAAVRDAAAAGVDVRWLSTWRGDTRLLLDIVPGLPELPWLDESILDNATADGLDPGERMYSGPWKVEVAKAYVPDDAPLLWTEDALEVDMLSESWRRDRKAPTRFLRPHPARGLERKHLRTIEEWVEFHSPPKQEAATQPPITGRDDGP